MNKVSVEQLINMNYVKYSKLTEIINSAFVGSKAEILNIYVDLYSILKPLYNSNCEISDYSMVTSCIINMCAHYRDFFYRRFGVNTKIFLVYSENCNFVNKQFYPEYNKKNEELFKSNAMIYDMIKNNMEILEILCPYLPDIHFVKGTFETGAIIYDIICRNELVDNSPHMIITKDVYNYQLVPTRDNIIILRPKKFNGQDDSYYINQVNLLDTYLRERKCEYRPKVLLMPGLLSLIMSLSSIPDRNIKSLLNITSTLKSLEKAIFDYKILNGHNSNIDLVHKNIDNLKISSVSLEFRFKAIDIVFQQSVYMNTPECKSITFVNLDDPETVKEINNKYFINNPLDLERL